jgi:hypothetical protein
MSDCDSNYDSDSSYKYDSEDEYGKCEIYEYFKMYGIENFNITSLGEYKIINKNHLLAYEQLWMNKLENINLNKAFTPINITKHLSKLIIAFSF